MHIRAVIFDMDGLLLDTEPVYIDCLGRAALEYGFQVSDELITACMGVSCSRITEALKEHFGPDCPADVINRKHLEYASEHFRSRGVGVKKGALIILGEIERRSIPKGLATSTVKETAESLLEKAGLAGRFQTAVYGDQIKQGKPAPDIFIEAASRLAVSPEACLVFEDSENGILAATGAGMRTILVPDTVVPPEEIRNLAYAEYPDLKKAAKELSSLLNL